MSHRIIPILTAIAVAASWLTGCGNPQPSEPNTLLTEQGRRELGVEELRVQCLPHNNGLSIRMKGGDRIAFFTNGPHFSIQRKVASRTIRLGATDITEYSATGYSESAQGLTLFLNRLCQWQGDDQRFTDRRAANNPNPPQPGIVYQMNEAGNTFIYPNANDVWEKTAIQALEKFRTMSDEIRAQQAADKNAGLRQQNYTLTP